MKTQTTQPKLVKKLILNKTSIRTLSTSQPTSAKRTPTATCTA